jgi:CHAD domain-containing protein
MADGKWITELTPTTPLADAARRALSLRLQVMHDYLPLAVRESDKDLEYVHQLRVGTRRAGAALEIFALCLPPKEYKAAGRQLKRLRRAAGAARDWDVFLESLAGPEGWRERQRPTHDLLVGYALAQRAVAQVQLEQASPNYPFDFERLMAETVAAVHKPHAGSTMQVLRDLAQPLLGGLLRELHQAASGDLDDYDHLHQVRIIGKRLRYAMEIVADCFAPAFRAELYPMVEEMQEILGHANDSHVASQRLELLCAQMRAQRRGDWRRFRPGLVALMQYHRERVPQERQHFQEWWVRWEKTGGQETFRGLLKTAEAPAVT